MYVFTCASWLGSDAGWQGLTISVLGQNGPVIAVKMAFCLVDAATSDSVCGYAAIVYSISIVWIVFASKMAEEGLMLAVRRDFFIPNLRFDWANTQMAAEHRLWEEQLEQKRLQCLLAFLWRFTSQMRDSNTFKTPMHAHAHPQLKWLDSTGSGCLEATKDVKFWMQRPAESAAISAKKSLQHGLWQGAERCRKLAESVARHVLKRVPSDSELFNRFVAIAFVSPLRCLCYGSCWPWSSFGALSVPCDWASAPV